MIQDRATAELWLTFLGERAVEIWALAMGPLLLLLTAVVWIEWRKGGEDD